MELIPDRRNEGYVPGQVLRDRVLIPGWEQRSVWGWDGEAGSLYAQLWQNTDPDSAGARYQVDGRTGQLLHPGHLALVLLKSTSLPAMALVDGLGLGSARVLRDRSNVWDLLEKPGGPPARRDGMTWGARWVLGKSTQCPGTGLPWFLGVSPTAQVLHAEHLYARGQLAQLAAHPGPRGGTGHREAQRVEGVIAVLDAMLVNPPT